MATRLAVKAGREALYDYLKTACTDGTLAPGSMLPAVRELSEQHGVTNHAVFQVIQRLTDAGLLYTVPRVGAFVGHAPQEKVQPYLMVVPPHDGSGEHYLMQAQLGFEDRIAQLGGHSVVLTPDETRLHLDHDDLPPLAGVFENLESVIHSSRLFESNDIPRVFFGFLDEIGAVADCVSFDDVGGGAAAARHLWQNGHRAIAFLSLHGDGDASLLSWSQRRESGWQMALEQMGGDTGGLAFRPRETSGLGLEAQRQAGAQAAAGIIGRTDITAVVVVNALAAEGMIQAFQNAEWPAEKWPSVVCFDMAPGAGRSVVSYLRLPWEDIGREVAQVLWERRTGRLTGAPVQRLVPMRLIPRLSCRPDWVRSSTLTQSHVLRTAPSKRRTAREPLTSAAR